MICTTYFLTFFSELIPPTGIYLVIFNSIDDRISKLIHMFANKSK